MYLTSIPFVSILLKFFLLPIVNCNEELLCDTCSGIVVDTDCGGDDAMAISLLLRAEALGKTSSWGKVIGITTVTGNTGAANASRNVQTLLRVLDRPEIPVYRGIEKGLAAYIQPTWFFGYDGLGDFLPPFLPKPITPSDINPGLYLASLVNRYPGQITILCIGPLTNVAMALHFNDNFFNQVRHIVILGGDYEGGGNMGPGTEANMYSDPDAASFFFNQIPASAASKITLVPIETIARIRYPMPYRLDVLGKIKTNLMEFLNKAERISFIKYGDRTWPCYDPTAAGILVDGNLVANSSLAWVEVVNQGPRGAMFALMKGHEPNVKIVTGIDQDKLSDLLQFVFDSDNKSNVDFMCNFYRKTSFWNKLFTGDNQLFKVTKNC